MAMGNVIVFSPLYTGLVGVVDKTGKFISDKLIYKSDPADRDSDTFICPAPNLSEDHINDESELIDHFTCGKLDIYATKYDGGNGYIYDVAITQNGKCKELLIGSVYFDNEKTGDIMYLKQPAYFEDGQYINREASFNIFTGKGKRETLFVNKVTIQFYINSGDGGVFSVFSTEDGRTFLQYGKDSGMGGPYMQYIEVKEPITELTDEFNIAMEGTEPDDVEIEYKRGRKIVVNLKYNYEDDDNMERKIRCTALREFGG